jgi:hypothetical protein
MDLPTIGTQKLSQSLPTVAMNMRVVVSML